MIFVNVKMNIDYICYIEMFKYCFFIFFSFVESCLVIVFVGKYWYRFMLWVRIYFGISVVCNFFWGNVFGSWSNWIL